MELRRFFALFTCAVLPVLALAAALRFLPADPASAPVRQADGVSAPASPELVLPERALPELVLSMPVTADKPAVPAMAAAEVQAAARPDPQEACRDGALTLRLLAGDQVLTLTMEDYLRGVVAAEMPASFPLEALKAQAVAARTDTLYRMQTARPHLEADCCAEAACCKAYRTDAELRDAWGADYADNLSRIRQAVAETDGQVLRYDGEPIFAAFHAASPGSTESSEHVWITALPYLRSVESAESADRVPAFYSAVTLSYPALQESLSAACPDWSPEGEPAFWLHDAEYTESGRLKQVSLGTETLSGTALRAALGLRSAAVTWTCGQTGIRFETAGYGHGVGMSQYGAEAMALDGATHGEILAHYYTGAELGLIE